MKYKTHGGRRPGAGRKPGEDYAPGYEPGHYTSLRLTAENYHKLLAIREQTGKPMAQVINELIAAL